MTTIIRFATEADAGAIGAIYAPYVRETVISFEQEPPEEATLRERIGRISEMFPWVVCQRDDLVVGYAYASRHRERHAYQWSVDVTVYVQQGLHRSGVGRGLYTSLIGLLRLQGFYNAYAGIALPNDASIGLHRALGFQPVGVYERVGYKLGKWHSVAWFGLALQALSDSPAPPRPIPAIMNEPETQAALASGLSLIRL